MRLTHWLARLARKHAVARSGIRRKRYGDVASAVELLEDQADADFAKAKELKAKK
jgi:hypothetical protein